MAEITTRTVRVFEVPRPLLRDFRNMPESKQVGVYFLFGSSASGSASCYIGRSGSIGDRLKEHSDKKRILGPRPGRRIPYQHMDQHPHRVHGMDGD